MPVRSRENLKGSLLKRTQESHDKMDDSGRFSDYFKDGVEGFKKWKCGEGEHLIDIIPWPIGKNFPSRTYPDAKEGEGAYVLDIWVHFNVGPNEDSYVCPARNYGDACPICEKINELRKMEKPDDDLIKSLNPKRRSVYNIVCYDTDEEEKKGIQIWEVAHFFMEKHLAERAKKPRGGGFITFSDLDEGKQVFFKRKGTGLTNTEYLNHQFMDRDYKISDEIFNAALILDEIIKVPSYEELYEAFYGEGPGEDRPTCAAPEDDDEPPVQSQRRTRRAPVQEEEPEKEEEEEPTSRRRRRAPVQEEEPEKEEAPAGDNKCPGGGTFGVDIDQLDACRSCEIWDDCAAENDRLEEEKKKQGNSRRRRRG